MKKTIAIIAAVIAAVLLTLSGCSDFAFNPVGRWEAVEMKIYEDGKLSETKSIDELGSSVQAALVFKKSGTGYIDSGTRNKLDFTYDYNDSEVKVSRSANGSDPVETVYTVSDNGSALSVTVSEYEATNSKGTESTYREEIIFKR